MRPKSIKASKSQASLTIFWEDGTEVSLPFHKLAAACRCASCNDARAKAMAAGTAHEPESSILDTIEAVGSYGVNILWVGGCRHGIYTWDYLYALGAGHTPTADHHRAW